MTKRFGHDGLPRMRLLCGGAIAILLGFIAIAGYTLVDAWRATWTNALQSSDNLTTALAHDIDRNITLYDLSLQTVVAGLKLPELSKMSPQLRDAVLFDGSSAAPEFGATFVVDEFGRPRIVSRPTPALTKNFAQRDFFIAQRDHRDLGLFISKPFPLSVSGQWAIALSRRLEHPDGSFAGIVLGSVKLAYFQRLFDSVDIGPEGTLSLLRTDGLVLVRKPALDPALSRSIPDFQGTHSRSEHFFEEAGKLDGIKRLFVHRQIGDLPLIVSVGPATKVIFAEWVQKAGITLALIIGLASMAGWLLLKLVNEFRRRAEAEQRAVASEQQHKMVAEASVEAHERVQRAEALLRDAVESISEGFVIFDADDRFVMCNTAYQRLHATLAPELRAGRKFEDILRAGAQAAARYDNATDWDKYIAERLEEHRNPPPQPVERQLWNGGRWVLISERRMSDGGTAGLQIDITALKKAQQALAENQKRLARAQRIAGVGDIEHDIATGSVSWSDHAYEIYGIAKGRVPTWDEFIALIHPEDRDRLASIVSQMQNGAPAPNFEYRIIRPDGQLRYLLRENETIRDVSGRVVRVASTVQDITELRQSQERERDLHAQLLHRQKLEALGTLAGGIAHDMNNTLVPILALSKRAMAQAAPGTRERINFEIVYRASEHARDLVKQILTFSRKEGVDKKPICIGAITRDALQMMRAGLPTTLALIEHIDTPAQVLGDAGQIRQVIINLVTNAAQAIGDTTGAITVWVETRDDQVLLRVTDTGCGIDEKHLPRLFDPFFTTKDAGQGTGLGLSVVHGIVAAHGGKIEVRSSLGEGAEFVVALPAVSGRKASIAIESAA